MRTRVKPIWYVAVALAALAAVNVVSPFVWMSTPISGQVVDRATGAPIGNAAVVASWALQGWEGSTVACLYLGETITDAKGHFRLGAWGPRFHFSQGRIMRTQPEMRVIADGYLPAEPGGFGDMRSALIYAGPKQNGQVFRLDRAIPGDGYERAVESFNNYFRFMGSRRHCHWSQIPQTMKRVDHARESD